MEFTFGETNMVVTDLQRSIDFYTEVMGFKVVEQASDYAHIRRNGKMFTLLKSATGILPEDYFYGACPVFSLDIRVKNIAEAVEFLRSKGVKFAKPWMEGDTYTFFFDPDMLVWELIEEGSTHESEEAHRKD